LAFSEQAALAVGLEPRQHQLLLAIVGSPARVSPTVGDVAEQLIIKHHSAVELIDRLARRGLVARLRNDDDRREVLLKVTAKGERLLRKLSVAHVAELRTRGPHLVKALRVLTRSRSHQGV